jgi:hypothetical protein
LERVYLSMELELDEFEALLKEFKNEKYLGLNGPLMEFYKKNHHEVALAYLKISQESICGGKLGELVNVDLILSLKVLKGIWLGVGIL